MKRAGSALSAFVALVVLLMFVNRVTGNMGRSEEVGVEVAWVYTALPSSIQDPASSPPLLIRFRRAQGHAEVPGVFFLDAEAPQVLKVQGTDVRLVEASGFHGSMYPCRAMVGKSLPNNWFVVWDHREDGVDIALNRIAEHACRYQSAAVQPASAS